ncbi:N-6 DNA methylase [Anoxybacillus kestanbolensis]|uniref:site-specific DNA-methyltransferase (adenine-specific) n=1 Tax=Anoxybacillus kestanbolensis TaxID=227476 RepID=A0A1V3FSH6_9BACL|nr:N-6 DNA methylase [Anoxybacillus kestanbolensis]OOE04653.1 N-6 DNA methylase [Anoxybacillus kestanbolensis]
MNYEQELFSLFEMLREEATVSDSLQIITSAASVKFLELHKEQYNLPTTLTLEFLLKEGAFLAEKLKAMLTELEERIPFLKGVYEPLYSSISFSDSTLYRLFSRVHSLALSKEQWTEFVEVLFARVSHMDTYATGIVSTPSSVNELGIRMLQMQSGSFYDGTFGLAGTLCAAHHYALRNDLDISLYGQEMHPQAWALGKLRLLFHGRTDAQLAQGDTLTQPAFVEGNKLKKFDYVMMDFPFGVKMTNYEAIIHDPFHRFVYGKLPRTSADMAFVLHALSSLNETGKAVLVVPNGTLFRGGPEAVIREHLLAADVIEAVIALPVPLDNTAVQTNLLVLNKNKAAERKGKVLFINAENEYAEGGRRRKYLGEEHVRKIAEIYHNGLEIEEISQFVMVQDIQETNLLSSRYLQSSELEIEPYGKVKFHLERIKQSTQVQPLKQLGTFYRGINISAKDAETENGEYKVIKLSDVQNGELLIEQLASYEIKNNAKIESYLVQEGDVIISSRGMGIKVAVIPPHEGKVLISHNFIGIRLNKTIDPLYLKTFLESPVGQYLLLSKQVGTNVSILSIKDLEDIPVPMLPLSEQQEMMKSYLQEQERLDQQIKQLQQQQHETKLKLYEKMGIRSAFEVVGAKI